MSGLLKLDGRTAKGKKWKELLDSGQSLKQGIVISSKLCSHCNRTPDMKTETVKCMSCSNVYHCPCLLVPLKPDYVKDISENPCLFWFCFECISLKKDGDRSSSQSSANEFVRKSDFNELMLYVGNTINEMQSKLVDHVDSQIQSALGKNEITPVSESLPKSLVSSIHFSSAFLNRFTKDL